MKTRYGIAKDYFRDDEGNERHYYFIAELYLDYDWVIGLTPIALSQFPTKQDAIRTIAQVVMDIMGAKEAVDARELREKGSVHH
jgi:hypothetical protein